MRAYKKITIVLVGALVVVMSISATLYSEGQNVQNQEVEISARLSANAIIVKDIEATVKFYTDFLGFSEYKRITIDNPKSLAVFGIKDTKKHNYVSLLPAGWSKQNPTQPGLNIMEIPNAKESSFDQNGTREPIMSEVIFAFSVKGLVEIEKRMNAAGVEVVVPFAKSATGKSYTITVLDPNGIRVQLYEFIQ